jgi:predicted DNA-binding transcriptional regulator YafY
MHPGFATVQWSEVLEKKQQGGMPNGINRHMALRPSNITTLNLALELLKRIPPRQKITATELHAQLKGTASERDLRSIQRQLVALCEHFDIECDATSVPFGYRWKENARGLSLPGLTESESLLLMLAKQHLEHLLPASVMASLSGFFEQARRNVQLGQSGSVRKPASDWLKKVRVVSTTVPMRPPKIAPGVFEALSSAVYRDEWLEIDYRNAKGEHKRDKKIMPLGIAQQGQRLFVPCVFHGHTDIRNIAVHRITKAKTTGLPFPRPADFDLETYDDEGRFGYGKAEKITIRCWINDYLKLLLEETPLADDQRIAPAPDGAAGWELTATVVNSMQLVWWLRSQGKSVRVLAPTALIEKI